jgi:outer membrane receptor protein involved in Fe transport
MKKILAGSASALSLCMLANPALAQQTQEPGTVTVVDEIIVTAQKREQRLQDVPVVVTVLSEQLLEDAGVRDIRDLAQLTPGLTVTSTFSEAATTARIRGIGTVGDNPGLESSVGVVIDGVYRPRNGVAFGDLGELSRIEVLKGPQGTLFGKNTSAGLINVVTRPASFSPEVGGELTFGDHGAIGGSVYANGPLVADQVAGRVFFAHRQRDGFLDVRTGNGPREALESSTQDYWTLRGQLQFDISARIRARLIGDVSRRDEDCCLGVVINRPPAAALADASAGLAAYVNPPAPQQRVASANRPSVQQVDDEGLSFEVNVDNALFGANLTSITALRRWETRLSQDSDFTAADLLYRPDDLAYRNTFETLTQELRLAGSTGHVDWMVGAFYADEDLERVDQLLFGRDFERFLSLLSSGGTSPTFVSLLTGLPVGSAFTAGEGQNDRYAQSSRSVAVFSNGDLRLGEQLTLSLGARFTSEEKTATANFDNTDDGLACSRSSARFQAGVWNAFGLTAAQQQQALGLMCLGFWNSAFEGRTLSQDREEREWSGTAKLVYRPSADLMIYGSYSRGYKAGGFNLDRTQTGITPDSDTSFPGEFVDSFEAGAKTDWLQGALLINGSVFHQVYSDFQLNTFLGTTYVVRSVPEVTSTGVDLDVLWRGALPGLTLQGGVTYAETTYGDDPVAGLPLLAGAQASFAPLWSTSAALTYERPLGAFLGRVALNLKHSSGYNTGSDLNPQKRQDAFALVGARIALAHPQDAWSLELWGQNLFDEDYAQVVFDASLQPSVLASFLGAPRTYGVTLRARY